MVGVVVVVVVVVGVRRGKEKAMNGWMGMEGRKEGRMD